MIEFIYGIENIAIIYEQFHYCKNMNDFSVRIRVYSSRQRGNYEKLIHSAD